MTTNPDNMNDNTSYQNQSYGVPSNDATYGQNGYGYNQNHYGIDPVLLEEAKKTKTWGLWSIIIACIGLFIGIFAWAGLGLAISTMMKTKKLIAAGIPANQTGNGLAIAGMIIGIVVAVLNIVFNVLRHMAG